MAFANCFISDTPSSKVEPQCPILTLTDDCCTISRHSHQSHDRVLSQIVLRVNKSILKPGLVSCCWLTRSPLVNAIGRGGPFTTPAPIHGCAGLLEFECPELLIIFLPKLSHFLSLQEARSHAGPGMYSAIHPTPPSSVQTPIEPGSSPRSLSTFCLPWCAISTSEGTLSTYPGLFIAR
jgi:hypothetical protein